MKPFSPHRRPQQRACQLSRQVQAAGALHTPDAQHRCALTCNAMPRAQAVVVAGGQAGHQERGLRLAACQDCGQRRAQAGAGQRHAAPSGGRQRQAGHQGRMQRERQAPLPRTRVLQHAQQVARRRQPPAGGSSVRGSEWCSAPAAAGGGKQAGGKGGGRLGSAVSCRQSAPSLPMVRGLRGGRRAGARTWRAAGGSSRHRWERVACNPQA